MALPIGHRNGVKIRNKGGALGRIRRPHGIPFYSPAETYEKRDLISSGPTSIRFTTRGIITDATPHTVGRLRGSASLHFMPQGSGSSEFTHDESESYKIKGTTTMHFFQKGELTAYHKMRAVSWIVFNLKMLIHKLTGETSMTFDATATLRSYKLRGIASIVFSLTGEMNKSDVVKYGLLYNFLVIVDIRNITAEGWHIPSQTEFNTIRSFYSRLAADFRETGTDWWIAPNDESTNNSKFNARGSGERTSTDSSFRYLNTKFIVWTSTTSGANASVNWIDDQKKNKNFSFGLTSQKWGASMRPIKNSTALSNGESGLYTGNDGRQYPTICINGIEILACNLAETKYRNGDSIPEVTDAGDWAALTTGALCAYDNDWTNVFE